MFQSLLNVVHQLWVYNVSLFLYIWNEVKLIDGNICVKAFITTNLKLNSIMAKRGDSNYRRSSALGRLEAQLKAGTKTAKKSYDKKVPLTEKDIKRINKEIENIKKKRT